MEVIHQQKAKVTRLEAEYKKEKAKRQAMLDSLSMNDKDKVQMEKENQQLKMLYTQEASAKTALHREREVLSMKLAKKKEKQIMT